jgi:molybdate transport system ATP-binding protein
VSLVLKGLRLRAGDFELAIDAEFGGGVTGVFGVSGAGKTSLLEVIAGLRRPSAGSVALDGVVLSDCERGVHIPPERRGMGLVPQDGALFPHLNVEGNVRFGERRAGGSGEIFARGKVCALLGIAGLMERMPSGLSGGERQRVALARALVSGPRLLLLDEPLAALDPARKEAVLPYLRRIRDELRVPILYVSHVPGEIAGLCDSVAVLAAGRMLQHGPVGEVFRRPASPGVAGIVGIEALFPGRVVESGNGLAVVAAGEARLVALDGQLPADIAEVIVGIRAEDVVLVRALGEFRTSARNHWLGTVRSVEQGQATVRVEVDCGFPLVALLTRQAAEELELAPGVQVGALVKAPHIHLMPR